MCHRSHAERDFGEIFTTNLPNLLYVLCHLTIGLVMLGQGALTQGLTLILVFRNIPTFINLVKWVVPLLSVNINTTCIYNIHVSKNKQHDKSLRYKIQCITVALR